MATRPHPRTQESQNSTPNESGWQALVQVNEAELLRLKNELKYEEALNRDLQYQAKNVRKQVYIEDKPSEKLEAMLMMVKLNHQKLQMLEKARLSHQDFRTSHEEAQEEAKKIGGERLAKIIQSVEVAKGKEKLIFKTASEARNRSAQRVHEEITQFQFVTMSKSVSSFKSKRNSKNVNDSTEYMAEKPIKGFKIIKKKEKGSIDQQEPLQESRLTAKPYAINTTNAEDFSFKKQKEPAYQKPSLFNYDHNPLKRSSKPSK